MDEISLVSVSCPACGSSEEKTICVTPDFENPTLEQFKVSECCSCGFVYTSIRPEAEVLFSDRFYPDEYLCFGKSKSGLLSKVNQKRIEAQAKSRCKRLMDCLPDRRKKLRVLEPGCASGSFLKLLQKQYGCDVTGIEPNVNLSNRLREEGVNAITGTFEDAELLKSHFDAVCMFNVIEHLWNPFEAIERMSFCLKKGGIVLIECPNFNATGRKIFGKFWFPYHLPRHLSHFNSDSLTRLFEKAGFSKVHYKKEFRPTVHVHSLHYLAKSFFSSKPIARMFSSANLALVMAAIPFEVLVNLLGDSNIMGMCFVKNQE